MKCEAWFAPRCRRTDGARGQGGQVGEAGRCELSSVDTKLASRVAASERSHTGDVEPQVVAWDTCTPRLRKTERGKEMTYTPNSVEKIVEKIV